jgi:hypothetical protein
MSCFASSAYFFRTTGAIFHPADDAVLTYLNDEGQSIEPKYYVPIVLFIAGSTLAEFLKRRMYGVCFMEATLCLPRLRSKNTIFVSR